MVKCVSFPGLLVAEMRRNQNPCGHQGTACQYLCQPEQSTFAGSTHHGFSEPPSLCPHPRYVYGRSNHDSDPAHALWMYTALCPQEQKQRWLKNIAQLVQTNSSGIYIHCTIVNQSDWLLAAGSNPQRYSFATSILNFQ